MFLFFYRLLQGYVYVRVTTKTPEKLLNLCAAHGIILWGVALRGERLYFKMRIEDFKTLRILHRTVCGKIHLTRKVGLPFFAAAHKNRYGFAAGFLLFCGILYMLSGYIWNICITGNQTISPQQLAQDLRQIGIYEGTPLKGLSVKEKRNELLMAERELAWASLNLEGCKLTLNVEEATLNPPQAKEEPANLKAGCDGVITKIELLAGTAAVKVGDTVAKGDLLAAGMVEYSDQSTRFLQARGKVFANTVREYKLTQPKTVTAVQRSGSSQSRTVLQFFGFHIPLFCGSVTGNFESEGAAPKISAGQSYLPVRLVKRQFFSLAQQENTLTQPQAEARLKAQLAQQLKQDVPEGRVLSQNLRFYVENGAFCLSAVVKCDENIAIAEKIIKDTGN